MRYGSGGIRRYPHAPAHFVELPGPYLLTAGTYGKAHHFWKAKDLDFVVAAIRALTSKYGLGLHAFAAFSNHYHLVVEATAPEAVPRFIQHLHGETGRYANARDGTQGRKVWYQCWDTYLDDSKSLYARWKYVLDNPVRHGLVARAEDYRWCSAREFVHLCPDRPLVCTVLQFETASVQVADDYEPRMPTP